MTGHTTPARCVATSCSLRPVARISGASRALARSRDTRERASERTSAPLVVLLFRSSSARVLYDPLNEVRQHNRANACGAARPCDTGRVRRLRNTPHDQKRTRGGVVMRVKRGILYELSPWDRAKNRHYRLNVTSGQRALRRNGFPAGAGDLVAKRTCVEIKWISEDPNCIFQTSVHR